MNTPDMCGRLENTRDIAATPDAALSPDRGKQFGRLPKIVISRVSIAESLSTNRRTCMRQCDHRVGGIDTKDVIAAINESARRA
jgi:hypothetical protein